MRWEDVVKKDVEQIGGKVVPIGEIYSWTKKDGCLVVKLVLCENWFLKAQ